MNPGARDGGTEARLARLLRRHPALARASAGVWPVRAVADATAALGGLPTDVVAVAAGGDGTANLVAQATLAGGDGRAFGVLPLGTGNAFAHSIGVGRLPAAVRALAAGPIAAMDVMRMSHPQAAVALVSLSVGFESLLMAALARRRRLSRAVGVLAGLRNAFGPRHRGVALWLDGRLALAAGDPFYNAGLYAQPCYAFGVRAFKDADACDGWGEARVSAGMAAYGRALAAGRGTSRWQHARVESALPLQVDGEPLAPASFDVHLAAAALPVVGAMG